MKRSMLDNDIRFHLVNNLLIDPEIERAFTQGCAKPGGFFPGSLRIAVEPKKLVRDDSSHSPVGIDFLLDTVDETGRFSDQSF